MTKNKLDTIVQVLVLCRNERFAHKRCFYSILPHTCMATLDLLIPLHDTDLSSIKSVIGLVIIAVYWQCSIQPNIIALSNLNSGHLEITPKLTGKLSPKSNSTDLYNQSHSANNPGSPQIFYIINSIRDCWKACGGKKSHGCADPVLDGKQQMNSNKLQYCPYQD